MIKIFNKLQIIRKNIKISEKAHLKFFKYSFLLSMYANYFTSLYGGFP